MYKMKYSCYQDCSVIHGWFVYCAFCWQMHRLSKSLEIRFRMASFSKMSLLTCPCLRRKRVEKSQAILEHLMTFRSSISTGKPEQLLSLMCFFFSVSWSEAYGLCGLSLYTSNDLTDNRCMTFADCRLQTADCRLQTAGCRLQTADNRLQTQTTDCRL